MNSTSTKENTGATTLYGVQGSCILKDGMLITADGTVPFEEVLAYLQARNQIDWRKAAGYITGGSPSLFDEQPPKHLQLSMHGLGNMKKVFGAGIGPDGRIWFVTGSILSTEPPLTLHLEAENEMVSVQTTFTDVGNVLYVDDLAAFESHEPPLTQNSFKVVRLTKEGPREFISFLYSPQGAGKCYEGNGLQGMPLESLGLPTDLCRRISEKQREEFLKGWKPRDTNYPAFCFGPGDIRWRFDMNAEGERVSIARSSLGATTAFSHGDSWAIIHALRAVYVEPGCNLIYVAERKGTIYKVIVKLS